MGFFDFGSHRDNHKDAHQEALNAGHKAHLSHELIASAASYEAMKAYDAHVAQNGHPASHAQAKELMAALAGGFIDRLIETKGLDYVDREKAKRQAMEHVDNAAC